METALLYKLNALLKYLKLHSPFYQERSDVPDHVKNLANFSRLMTTGKQDLVEHTGQFCCVTPNRFAEVVSTSGSTGQPLYIKMTSNDKQRLATIEKHNFAHCGFGHQDIVQIMATTDRLFIAGLAYYSGLAKLDATVIRAGAAPIPAQAQTITDLGANCLVGVPSLLLPLASQLQSGPWPAQIERLMVVGETIYDKELQLNNLGQQLLSAFPQAAIFCSYGNTEIQGSFCDCAQHAGMHANEKYFFVEILDEAGNVLPDHQVGELTVTTLELEGMPLLRYRTGDLTYKISSPCKCGLSSSRIGPILARKNQLLKIKGTSLYPSTLDTALHKLPDLQDYLIIATSDARQLDRITLLLTMNGNPEKKKIEHFLKSELKFTPELLLVDPTTLEAERSAFNSRKKLFFLDKR